MIHNEMACRNSGFKYRYMHPYCKQTFISMQEIFCDIREPVHCKYFFLVINQSLNVFASIISKQSTSRLRILIAPSQSISHKLQNKVVEIKSWFTVYVGLLMITKLCIFHLVSTKHHYSSMIGGLNI